MQLPPDPPSDPEKSFGPWFGPVEKIINRLFEEESSVKAQQQIAKADRENAKSDPEEIKMRVRAEVEDYLRNAAMPVLLAIQASQQDVEAELKKPPRRKKISASISDCREHCRRWLTSEKIEELIADRKAKGAAQEKAPDAQPSPADEIARLVTRVLEELLPEVRKYCSQDDKVPPAKRAR